MLEIKEITDIADIHVIKPLWEVLNRDLQSRSKFFADYYRNLTFEDYMDSLKASADCRLEAVFLDEKPLGFCLGTVKSNVGTVEELYLYDDLRGNGLGQYLFERMVLWLETQETVDIEIHVPAGYEFMMQFYQKLGFKTSSFLMKRKKWGAKWRKFY